FKTYFITKATVTADTKLKRYMPVRANPCRLNTHHTLRLGTTSAISKVYIGKRAEQVTNGVTMIVIIRSFQFSILRVLIIDGTAQAKPPISGTTDLPFNPTLRISLSIINVTRDI